MDIIKKLRSILDRKQKIHMCGLAFLIFVGGWLETLSISALLPIVWIFIDEEKALKNKYFKWAMDWLNISDAKSLMIVILVALIALYIVKNIFLLISANEQARFIAYNRNKMISRVLREFLNRPYEFYLDADIPTVFRLTDSDIPNVFNMLVSISSMASEVVVAVLFAIFLILTDWKITIFTVAVFGVLTLFITKIMKPILAGLGQKNLKVQSRIAKWRIQAIYGIKDVKVLHRESFFADNYEGTGKIGAVINRKYTVMNNLPRILIETVFMCSFLAYLMVYILNGNDVKAITVTLTSFGLVSTRLLPCVSRINNYIAQIAYVKPCLDYVYENFKINAETQKQNYNLNVKDESLLMELKDKIELKDIVYAYPNTDKLIFNHASMEVPYGKSVGIMGPSGAGKSTIVDILLGLLKVHNGTITCDGVNVFDNYPAWLAQIGYIPQTIYLVDEPIRNNIAFGMLDEDIDDNRIWQVLEEAQMKEFVEQLPEGLDTTIGDRGVRLSGGQRQRLGIARALYHNPEILVFDEATSALDNETEQAVMDAINNFHGKKTMVIIAHRLNTIEKCDIIYKVNNGVIEKTELK